MDRMRAVAHQRQPRIGDARGMVEAKRVARTRPCKRYLAEEPAHPLLRLGQPGPVG